MRETFVMRGGELVPKSQAEPLRSPGGPMVISDEVPAFWSPVDGKHYTSKSRHRAEVRARGLTEVGTEKQVDSRKPFAGTAHNEVKRAIQMVSEGYRPQVRGENNW